MLTGAFAAVTLTCCTLDPGSGATPDVFDDPRRLAAAVARSRSPPTAGRSGPTRLWIEGSVTTLTVDRCVLGPIRTRGAGVVETTTISNTTLQAIRTSDLGPISADEVKDPARLERAAAARPRPGLRAAARASAPAIGATLGPVGLAAARRRRSPPASRPRRRCSPS